MRLPPLQFRRSKEGKDVYDAMMGKIVVGRTKEGDDCPRWICFMPTTEGARPHGWTRAINAVAARRALSAAVSDCFSWMGFR